MYKVIVLVVPLQLWYPKNQQKYNRCCVIICCKVFKFVRKITKNFKKYLVSLNGIFIKELFEKIGTF